MEWSFYTLSIFLVTSHAQNLMPSCILPQRPIGGRFQLVACTGSSCDVNSGGKVPIGSLLSYTCDEGYTLQGNTISSCYMNEWYMPPTCVKSCPGLKSDSVDIKCIYRGEIVSCKSGVLPGTKATLACKLAYKIPLADDPGYRELICLDEGSWDRNMFQCIPECGITVPHGQSLIVNGFPAKYPTYPWHVGIYRRMNTTTENFHQICGGTLVSPDLVVSAAHCFWDDTIRRVTSANKFAVAAGKYYRAYNIPLVDAFAQKSEVKKIDIAERFFGISGNYAHDIALLRVKTPFMLNTLVRPICVDWDNRHEVEHLRGGRSGKAVGWGRTETGVPSSGLREINLPFIPHHNCVMAVPEDFKGFVTPDKFCAGYLNGTSLCEGDSGGGLFFQFHDLWFLRGIVSVAPVTRETRMCDNNYYSAFTNVGLFLGWIRTIYFSLSHSAPTPEQVPAIGSATAPPNYGSNSAVSTSGCILPGQPADGSFEIGSCEKPCNVLPGTRVSNGSFLIYRCKEGYSIEGNDIVSCNGGIWTPIPICMKEDSSIKKCPALRSKSVDFICKHRDKIVSCESAIAPSTVATITCKNYYRIPLDLLPGYNEITCLEDGKWDRTIFKCIPECGIAVPEGTRIIVNGTAIKYNRFPWRVFIYVIRPSGSPIHICTGTLISPNLVISRVTCFLTEDGKEIFHGSYLATVGKYGPTYNTLEPYAQQSLVERIVTVAMKPDFSRRTNANIALIRLRTAFTMTTLVRPICVDWRNFSAQSERIEELTGAPRRDSPLYSPKSDCLWKTANEDRMYVDTDKFCVGCDEGENLQNSNVCSVQGHGGFACEFRGEWNLVGIHSRSVTPDDKLCAKLDLYTKVAPYLSDIEEFYIRMTA